MIFYLYVILCFIWNYLFGDRPWWNTAFQGLKAFFTSDASIESAIFGSFSSKPIYLPLIAFCIPFVLRQIATLIGSHPSAHRVDTLSRICSQWYRRQWTPRYFVLHALPYICILTLSSASISIWHMAALPLVVYHGFVAILSLH